MGWPRKNDGSRLYQERKDKSFLLVITENGAIPVDTSTPLPTSTPTPRLPLPLLASVPCTCMTVAEERSGPTCPPIGKRPSCRGWKSGTKLPNKSGDSGK